MTSEILNQKEKELIAVGCAVSAGCQRCCNHHFKKVLEVGANLAEVKQAVLDAMSTIHHADEMMQRKAYALMEVSRPESPVAIEAVDRMTALVKLGAAVAKKAYADGRPVKEVAKEMTDLSDEELDRLLDPAALTEGGIKH